MSQFSVYKKRWAMLGIFAIVSAGNALTWISFAPISDKVERFYSVTSLQVNWLSMIFMLMYPLGTVIGSFCLDRYGAKMGLGLGASFTAIGAWVRAIGSSPTGFGWVFFGQTLCAFFQPFLLNAPPVISARWFPEKERTIATTIATVANPIGIMVGFLIPPAVVNTFDQVPTLLWVEGIIVTVLSLAVFLYSNDPPTPPSQSASDKSPLSTETYLQDLRRLMTVQFLWLCISFGIGLAIFNALATVVNQLLYPFSYSNDQAGTSGALVIVIGLVGAAIVGAVVDVTHRYKHALIICYVASALTLLWLAFALQRDNFVSIAFCLSLFGFSLTPVLAVSFELAAEAFYPIGEATPTGVLMSIGNLLGGVLVFPMDAMISANGENGSRGVAWLCFGGGCHRCDRPIVFQGGVEAPRGE